MDESTALEQGQWYNGRIISYSDYLKLTHDTQDQTARQALQLSQWRSAMHMKFDQDDSALRGN